MNEDLEAQDPNPPSRDMTLVDVSYRSVLRRLDTMKYLCENLREGLAHRSEETISGTGSEDGTESLN